MTLRCLVCGEGHEPSSMSCDEAGMEREIGRMGAKRWNRITAEVSRKRNCEHRMVDVDAPCEYCGPGKFTGLPGNACENCMNTGFKYPQFHYANGEVAKDD